jgi:hypothetical protein
LLRDTTDRFIPGTTGNTVEDSAMEAELGIDGIEEGDYFDRLDDCKLRAYDEMFPGAVDSQMC